MSVLSFAEFSKQLIETGDLDPEYIFINNVCQKLGKSDEWKADWILLKSCIYRSESELSLLMGYEKSINDVKLGDVRRKSRAQVPAYYRAFVNHTHKYADSALGYFHTLPKRADHAMQVLKEIHGVGNWAAWKILDLLSCCLNMPFDFTKINFPNTYEFPLKGMLMVAGEAEDNVWLLKQNPLYYQRVYYKAVSMLGPVLDMKAPPLHTRKINLQEIESCFCKYHSYIHKHYHVGKDTNDIRHEIAASKYPAIRALKECV